MKNVSKNIQVIIIVILCFLLVVLGIQVSSQNQEIENLNESNEELDILLNGPNKVRGYSCGILSEQKAKDLLESSSVKSQYGITPRYRIQEFLPAQEKMFWADSCRYEDNFESTKYVELYINSFQTPEDAQNAFPDFARIVNDSEEVDASLYGEKLIYDGGTYTLLKRNQVVQIAANNGVSNIAEFSRTVLEELTKAIN